jgi:phage-related protein
VTKRKHQIWACITRAKKIEDFTWDPPLTQREIDNMKECWEISDQARKEGRNIVWDMPDDE